MTRRPEFEELVGEIDDPEERERLERTHELLLRTEAPPELSLELETTPPATMHPWARPMRRRSPRFAFAVAAVVVAFAVGFLAGSPRGAPDGVQYERTVALRSDGDAIAHVGIGRRDEHGNLPMILTVTGLERLQGADYYTLALTRDGEPVVTCVTFNVAGPRTTIRFVAAYDLKRFDGWAVTLWDAETREEKPVLRTRRI